MTGQTSIAAEFAPIQATETDSAISDFLTVDDYSDEELESRISKESGGTGTGYC